MSLFFKTHTEVFTEEMILSLECALKYSSAYEESRWRYGWNKMGSVSMVKHGT